MKISYRWLQDYLNIDLPAEKISTILTDAGLEVSAVEKYQNFKGGLEGFVVGHVEALSKHPNADKLKLTKINIGQGESLNVVCGAPNVAQGQNVVLATIGTHIYTSETDFFTIQKSKIRGEVSEGMLCSEKEIGLSEQSDGLLILPSDLKPGTKLKDYFEVYEDTVFEVELTPNRGDAASHIGVARDIYAALYSKSSLKLQKPDITSFKLDSSENPIQITVENTEACPRYAGLYFKQVQVKESPNWLKNRLLSVGLRPINNVVDITNYVMYETGQPLHAFDGQKIKGQKVLVKTYAAGTMFTTLDGVERKLRAEDLMIGHAEKPMCIAGVYGGIDSGVNLNTQELFLESACFEGRILRKTSKHHNLFTDASFRYERDTDIEMVDFAMKRAALLLKEITGAQICGPISDLYPNHRPKINVLLRWTELQKIMGIRLDHAIVKQILTRLNFEITTHPEGLTCIMPTNKTEVTREIDVIEEIARIYGLNQIPVSNHVSASIENKSTSDVHHTWREKMSSMLTSNGYFEAMNNSLIASTWIELAQPQIKPVQILNPLSSDLNVMRTSLVYGLLQNVAYNLNRHQSNIKFFEFGAIYQKNKGYSQHDVLGICLVHDVQKHWKNKDVVTDYYTLKSACEMILNRAQIETSKLLISDQKTDQIWSEQMNWMYDSKILLSIGQVSEHVVRMMNVKSDVYYAEINWTYLMDLVKAKKSVFKPVNKYPEVTRDLALLVDEHVRYADLEKTAFETEKKFLKSVDIFDVYQGKNLDSGKKSYALRFVLENREETLKDEQIEKIMSALSKTFSEKHQATIRA